MILINKLDKHRLEKTQHISHLIHYDSRYENLSQGSESIIQVATHWIELPSGVTLYSKIWGCTSIDIGALLPIFSLNRY